VALRVGLKISNGGIARKHAYKMQLLLERQIGFHYYEQVSGPT
jgi:hypothetical protein